MNAGSDWPSSRALATRRDYEPTPPVQVPEGLSLGDSLGQRCARVPTMRLLQRLRCQC
jgi:hypothetical protein